MKHSIAALLTILILFGCLSDKNYDSDRDMCDLLAYMTEQDQRIRSLPQLQKGVEPPTNLNLDSLWNKQHRIDDFTTKKLITITQKRGWPISEEMGCEKEIDPVTIWSHAPEKYLNEIRSLIEVEFNEKRMPKHDYEAVKKIVSNTGN